LGERQVGEDFPAQLPEEKDGYFLPLEEEEEPNPEEEIEKIIRSWVSHEKAREFREAFREMVGPESRIAQYTWALIRGNKRELAELLWEMEVKLENLDDIVDRTYYMLEKGELTPEKFLDYMIFIKRALKDVRSILDEIRSYKERRRF